MGGGSPDPDPSSSSSSSSTPPEPGSVSLLILGAGWTSTFLIPLLKSEHPSLTYAATSRSGHDSTIPFTFDPSSNSLTPYRSLPSASTILIVFPLVGAGQSRHLVALYRRIHGYENRFVQLGSTGIWGKVKGWVDRTSVYDRENERAIAEDELLSLDEGKANVVLNLSGLYGGARHPAHWISRLIATTKEQLSGKTSIHLIHGRDVARAIVAVHENMDKAKGKRWLLTDLRVYDWWDLVQMWGPRVREGAGGGKKKDGEGEGKGEGKNYEQWVGELMMEYDVRALPRGVHTLGRMLDSRAFWNAVGTWPQEGSVLGHGDF